jgi:glycosyltransferase involved in cell wall biosynthesis
VWRLVHLTTTDMSLELLLGPQLSAFIDAGYEVIGMSAPGPFVPAIEARGVRHVPLANATRAMSLRRDAAALVELRRRFVELRPDIVHTHNPKPGVYGRLAARAARVPVIVNTVHGLYATPEDRLAKRVVVYSLERVAATCSHAELVQNVEDIAVLRRLRIPESKLAVLGNGVDLGRFGPVTDLAVRAQVRRGWGVADDALVVGAVGRLVLEKGYRELFEAWATVRCDHPDAELVVIGPTDDDKADALPPDVVDLAERHGVRLVGHRDDIEDCYRAMDLYVLASHREGFPRSAMEAAASGLPIVATDIRGCRQVVDDGVTGVLVPVRSPTGLAAAISALLADPDRRAAMSAAATERARTHFDQQRVIDLTLATYDRLLHARGRDGGSGVHRGEPVPPTPRH